MWKQINNISFKHLLYVTSFFLSSYFSSWIVHGSAENFYGTLPISVLPKYIVVFKLITEKLACRIEISLTSFCFQLSFGGSSPVLSDRDRYPFFYRMGTPDQKYIMARIELMKKYNWSRIATIHQAIEFFSVVSISSSIYMFLYLTPCCTPPPYGFIAT